MSHYSKKNKWLVFLIIFAFILRLYGIDWDQGFHLHPDERMLIMVADRINFFTQLNPHFFNYGTLPIYILKGTSQLIDWIFKTNVANYQGMLFIGRFLSSMADIGTIIVIYKLTEIIFPTAAFLAAFFYTIAFFPIQNSHFFIADTFLTFFSTLLVYLLIKIIKNRNRHISNQNIFFLGLTSAAIITTKVSGIIFVGLGGLTIFVFTLWRNKKHKITRTITNLTVFVLSFLIFSFIFMPYAFISYSKFTSDVLAQVRMNSDPYIFPYTLQYVGSLPYLYYLKNIFFWGLGPIISFFSLVGIVFLIKNFHAKRDLAQPEKLKIYFIGYYLIYFLIIGHSAVKFMRYMLPIYPFLAILAGYGLSQILNTRYQISWQSQTTLRVAKYQIPDTLFTGFILLLTTIWTLMFFNIYCHPPTRVMATQWINSNIPAGSTLAVEHWDDRLPLYGGEKYHFAELPLYNQPDNNIKWRSIDKKLATANYIIIASNRLYVPLQRLNNCHQYKICYPKTADYYRRLFRGEILETSYGPIRFQKVAEFAVYPGLTIGPWQLKINDQKADESFTVYDHPKIIIFKQEKQI